MEYEDFMKQQQETNELKSINFSLLGDTISLQNTVALLLKVKCKRSTSLTINVQDCIHKYFDVLYEMVNNDDDMKSVDLLVWFITKLLRGTYNKETSCIILDTNAILYTEVTSSHDNNINVVTTIEAFSIKIQSLLKQLVMNSGKEMSKCFSECWLVILNNERFETLMRKALNIYKQRLLLIIITINNNERFTICGVKA
jgi:hypothetical protein